MSVSPEQRRDEAAKSFAKNAARLALTGDFLGRKFTVDGVEYTVVGLNRRIRKLPVVAEAADGSFKTFPWSAVVA